MDHVVLGKLSEILDVINQIRSLNFRNQQLAKELEAEQEALLSLVRELGAQCRAEVAYVDRSAQDLPAPLLRRSDEWCLICP